MVPRVSPRVVMVLPLVIAAILLLIYLYTQRKAILNVYYINIDKAQDRNIRFIKNNTHPSLKLNRINGITPETIKNLNVIVPESCFGNTELELCCSISHLKAIHTAFHENNKYALIMEDDIYFLKHPNWTELRESAPSDWDILQLFTFSADVYENPNDNWIKNNGVMWSTGSYLINRDSMEKILKIFVPDYKNKNWNSIKEIDFTKNCSICAADFFIYRCFNTYTCTQILFNAEGFDSYLHSDHLAEHNIGIKRINELYKRTASIRED